MDTASILLGRSLSGGGGGGSSEPCKVIYFDATSSMDQKKAIMQQALEMYQSGTQPMLVLTKNADTGQTPVVMSLTDYSENDGSGSITFSGIGISPNQTNAWEGVGYNTARNYVFSSSFSDNQVYSFSKTDSIVAYLINDIMKMGAQTKFYELGANREINLTGVQLLSMLQSNPKMDIRIHELDSTTGDHYFYRLDAVYDERDDVSLPRIDAVFYGAGDLEMGSLNSGEDNFKDANA